MKEERYHLTLDRYDKNIVINALNTLRIVSSARVRTASVWAPRAACR